MYFIVIMEFLATIMLIVLSIKVIETNSKKKHRINSDLLSLNLDKNPTTRSVIYFKKYNRVGIATGGRYIYKYGPKKKAYIRESEEEVHAKFSLNESAHFFCFHENQFKVIELEDHEVINVKEKTINW